VTRNETCFARLIYLLADFFAGPAPAPAFGDLVPYQEEYSNEFRNSWSMPQSLHLPLLTAPLGGSITQWWVQSPSAPSVVPVVLSEAEVDLDIDNLPGVVECR